MIRLLVVLCMFVGGLCRSMPGPPPQECIRIATFQTECNAKVLGFNATGLFSMDPWDIKLEIADEFCRFVTDQHGCVMSNYPFLQTNCPIEMIRLVDAASRVIFGGCSKYKEDFVGIIPCLNADQALLFRIGECGRKIQEQIGSNGLFGDCSYFEKFGSCIDLLTPCAPQHLSNLKQFLSEARDDVCYIVKSVVAMKK